MIEYDVNDDFSQNSKLPPLSKLNINLEKSDIIKESSNEMYERS